MLFTIPFNYGQINMTYDKPSAILTFRKSFNLHTNSLSPSHKGLVGIWTQNVKGHNHFHGCGLGSNFQQRRYVVGGSKDDTKMRMIDTRR